MSRSERAVPYLFILPFALIFIMFLGLPFFYAFYLSFHKVVDLSNVFGGLKFVGLENYKDVVLGFEFWWALALTLIYALIMIPLNIVLALIIARMLLPDNRINRVYRALFFLPFVLDAFVVGVVWTLLYATPYGVIAQLMSKVGIAPPTGGFLGNPKLALPSVAIAMVLKNIGFGIILFIAAFGSIPKELFEAAELDGANAFQRTIHITIPMLKPIIAFLVIVGFMGALSGFAEIYAMTGGGPIVQVGSHLVGATKITGFLLYEHLQQLRLGMASALSFVLLTFALAFSLISLKILRRGD